MVRPISFEFQPFTQSSMHNYQFNKLAAVVIRCSKLRCLSFSSLFVLSGVPSWLLSATPTRTHCPEEGVSPDGGDSTDSGGVNRTFAAPW